MSKIVLCNKRNECKETRESKLVIKHWESTRAKVRLIELEIEADELPGLDAETEAVKLMKLEADAEELLTLELDTEAGELAGLDATELLLAEEEDNASEPLTVEDRELLAIDVLRGYVTIELLIEVTGGTVVVELTMQDAGMLQYGAIEAEPADDPVYTERFLVLPG